VRIVGAVFAIVLTRPGRWARGLHRHRLVMVDNQAIVIPETIDAIRALTGTVRAAHESILRTNTALGIETSLM
jgi:hypothetical protein